MFVSEWYPIESAYLTKSNQKIAILSPYLGDAIKRSAAFCIAAFGSLLYSAWKFFTSSGVGAMPVRSRDILRIKV
ncbi:MAG TPA: hypothetical protein DCE22_02125 [Verrucomicrobiales bacterium]|nr:hypothetical protein [Verrucomicrobiales bacterium]